MIRTTVNQKIITAQGLSSMRTRTADALYSYTPRGFPNEAKQQTIRQIRFVSFCFSYLSALGVVYRSIYYFIMNSHLGRWTGTTPLEPSCRPSPLQTFPLEHATTGNSLVAVHRHDLVVYSHPGSRRGTTLP